VQNDPVTEAITAPGSGGDPSGGLAKAVEMCNNNGHCRKFDAGTMCPSFRVTRDEQHLTRGRANTLRLALSGQLEGVDAVEPLASDAVQAALDLCVACKGCKRDCPTGVDMARMKIEATARRKALRGFSLRDRCIGGLPAMARIARRMPGLANLRNRIPLLRRLGERWLGISARRSLPAWRRDSFDRIAPTLGLAGSDEALAAVKAVVLFVDTFNGNFETENAVAAVRVLKAAGYAVHVARGPGGGDLCCGRTLLAAGMADRAKARAGELLTALLPFAERGIAIVGLEPSCLFTLRDEMQVMGLGEPAAKVGAQALLFEEFVVREASAGRFAPRLSPLAQPILVHPHCHQKAFGTAPQVLEALRLIPGAAPKLIESSCCGMAGSFGYEAEHHDISLAMAELSLLPAVRQAPDALLVADGTSCRHQIADGAGREALHLARVLADRLA
jgi:Fe-S oxidoreductase